MTEASDLTAITAIDQVIPCAKDLLDRNSFRRSAAECRLRCSARCRMSAMLRNRRPRGADVIKALV